MNDGAIIDTPGERLLSFLLEEDDEAANSFALELANAGGTVPMQFGGREKITHPNKEKAQAIQIQIAIRALERSLAHFDEVLDRVQRRIKRASMLRLAASIITLVLSSSVVIAALRTDGKSVATAVLGILTLIGSLFSLVAGWLEGGHSKLPSIFTKLSVLHAEALGLQDRLRSYQSNPTLFGDVDKRLGEAATIVGKLGEYKADLALL